MNAALPGREVPARGAWTHRTGGRRRSRPSGVTLIELMVGLALGLIVTAACVMVWAAQLREERSQLAEARLTQDLRSALDLVGRDLRRAGYWGDASRRLSGVTTAQPAGPIASNPYDTVAPTAGRATAVDYVYSLDTTENGAVDARERFGFRQRGGTLEAQVGSGNWQALTDPSITTVTRFEVTPSFHALDLGNGCPRPCNPATGTCPVQRQRTFDLLLAGRLANDPSVVRTLGARVLLRNPSVSGACVP